jgi:hypothetical protein
MDWITRRRPPSPASERQIVSWPWWRRAGADLRSRHRVAGRPVIDTPENHQRRELLVPAFAVKLVKQDLATLPDDADTFVFPGP